MALEFYPINGYNENIDYKLLENSYKNTLSKTAKNSKLFILNKFPSSRTVYYDALIILSVMPEDSYDYYRIPNKIFCNAIIPIKFYNIFTENKLSIQDNDICYDDYIIDFSYESNTIKNELVNYLSNRFNFQDVSIYPLIHLFNQENLHLRNITVGEKFDFTTIDYFLKSINTSFINSLEKLRINQLAYITLNDQVQKIIEQASIDSAEGYITLNKINRLTNQLSRGKQIYENLGKSLFIIKGKPGTGKSSELLYVLSRSYIEGKNVLLLSYNRLLLYEFSRTFNYFRDNKINHLHNNSSTNTTRYGEITINSFHEFFYRLSKNAGVLMILSYERFGELIKILDERLLLISNFFNSINNIKSIDDLKTKINYNYSNDKGLKNEALDYINFLLKKVYKIKESQNKYFDFNIIKQPSEFIKYKKFKEDALQKQLNKSVFLTDYINVLKVAGTFYSNPEKYYEDFIKGRDQKFINILLLQISGKDNLHINGNKETILNIFRKIKNKSTLNKDIILVDEAQDCFKEERDLLYAVYNPDQFVVVDGGKEQLIRNNEPCNWAVNKYKKINYLKPDIRLKSTRQKKNLVHFINFIAQKFNLDFNLQSDENLEDGGEIIFDFRTKFSSSDVIETANYLNNKGYIHKCSDYESLMVICDPRSRHINSDNNNKKESISISQDDNIIVKSNLRREWYFLNNFKDSNFTIWNGTVEDKKELEVPSPYHTRILYYESTRGLEAWSIMAFSLDVLFEIKYNDDEADKNIEDNLFISEEERRTRYAANWLIMALTRAMDTIYINVDFEYYSKEFKEILPTRLPDILREYANLNSNVKILTD